eukprot:g17367.t1
MWGNLVENLGLKEGLAEFTEQFNKDAKTTIANTQFAKDRGIDVAKLDQWEQHIQEQAIHKTTELHERTIGRAVESLAQDETIAQLLELKQRDSLPEEGLGAADEEVTSAGASGAQLEDEGPIEQPEANDSDVAPSAELVHDTQVRTSTAERAERAPKAKCAGRAATDARPLGPATEQLEVEVASPSRDEAFAHLAELEGRLAELSGVSDDALRQADEAKEEVLLLRRAAQEKTTKLLYVDLCCDFFDLFVSYVSPGKGLGHGTGCRGPSETGGRSQVFGQKEQELLDEVTYLRRAGEAKERRIQDLQAEKAAMERRFLVKASAGVDSGDIMLEAHTAIAKAFGDVTVQHPCLRLLDEPMLKFMAVLFKQPLFRRMFFGATTLLLYGFVLVASLLGQAFWQAELYLRQLDEIAGETEVRQAAEEAKERVEAEPEALQLALRGSVLLARQNFISAARFGYFLQRSLQRLELERNLGQGTSSLSDWMESLTPTAAVELARAATKESQRALQYHATDLFGSEAELLKQLDYGPNAIAQLQLSDESRRRLSLEAGHCVRFCARHELGGCFMEAKAPDPEGSAVAEPLEPPLQRGEAVIFGDGRQGVVTRAYFLEDKYAVRADGAHREAWTTRHGMGD